MCLFVKGKRQERIRKRLWYELPKKSYQGLQVVLRCTRRREGIFRKKGSLIAKVSLQLTFSI